MATVDELSLAIDDLQTRVELLEETLTNIEAFFAEVVTQKTLTANSVILETQISNLSAAVTTLTTQLTALQSSVTLLQRRV